MDQKNTTKNVILGVVLVGIAVSIVYLESQKSHEAVNVQSIAITDATQARATETTTTGTTTQDAGLKTTTASAAPKQDRSAILKAKAAKYPPAVELIPGGGFINTDPFTLKSLIGKKVILVDFWTYSCINCQRVTPYLNAWYDKYKDQGLVIVGVHTPEFDFEKDYNNVKNGVADLGIKYPVVQDNNMSTWNAYGNRYWPHEYLIDIDGYIVHDKIGEGGYDESEKAIQTALQERANVLGLNQKISTGVTTPSNAISVQGQMVQSPETYFGSARNEYFGNGKQGTAGSQTLTLPTTQNANTLYLDGTWNFESQFAQNTSLSAKIVYKYSAKNVYFVASSDNGVKVKILRDGKVLTGAEAGKDVAADGTLTIKENRLYTLVNGADYGEHTLQIEVEGAGLDAFTFTFG